MCLVSLITPCYNRGIYIHEAIASIPYEKLTYEIEHIIVNDGSTDPFTLEKLNQLEENGYKVIHQENLGLAAARNNAIKVAKGKYILPLDSDNKLHENYLTKAVEILENDDSIDVVYGDCLFFGEKNSYMKNRKFDIIKMLDCNYIDACAIYRKKLWVNVNGYDGKMPVMGCEDWEFWVASFFKGGSLLYLNDLCFFYRVTQESMTFNITRFGFDENREYVLKKYSNEFYNFYRKYFKKIEYFKQNRHKSAINYFLGRVIL